MTLLYPAPCKDPSTNSAPSLPPSDPSVPGVHNRSWGAFPHARSVQGSWGASHMPTQYRDPGEPSPRLLSAGTLGSLPPTHSMKGTLGSLPHTHSVQGSWGASPAPAQCMGSSFWVHTACNCLCLSLSDTAHSHGKVEHSRVGGRPAGGAAGPPTDIVS